MSAVDSSDWLGKLIEQESDEVWLRSGVRILVLLVLIALGGAAIVFLENAATGDVSLITRMASFTFSLFALWRHQWLLSVLRSAWLGGIC